MTSPLCSFSSGSAYVRVDYHMHTYFSDGESSVQEYASKAQELGLEEIAITDHVWQSSEWVDEYVDEIDRVNQASSVVIHSGLEAKVIDTQGNVDVSPADAEKVDFIMGVVHRYQPAADEPEDDILNFSAAEAAVRERELTIALLQNEVVDVVGHPTRTYYKFFFGKGTSDHFPQEHLNEMIDASKATGTPLEYNARLPTEVRKRLLDLYVRSDVQFTVGSDAHQVDRLALLNHEPIRMAIK